MLACLVIATTPTGSWIGLDALLFGPGRRRRELARERARAEAEASHEPGRIRESRSHSTDTADTGPIPF
jgi:hypothetical protein